MSELTCKVPVPKTSLELEQAIQRYKTSDCQGMELFCLWQAIRDASIAQNPPEPEDTIPGEDSY